MFNNAQIVIRTSFTKKDGSSPLGLRLIFSRKVKVISLHKSVPIKYWQEKEGLVHTDYEGAEALNLLLKSHLKRANDIIFDYEVTNRPLSFGEFLNEFKNKKTQNFYEFVEREFENNKNTRINSEASLLCLKTDLSKLKKFRRELCFSDITVSFLESYEGYMRNKLGNQINTIHKSLKFIRTFLNRAIRLGLIQENVFKRYRLKTEAGKRQNLSLQELNELEGLLEKPIPGYFKNIVKIFLFSCYTGLRYGDMRTLRYGNIADNVISIAMHKTKDIVSIPLTAKAKLFIGYGDKEERIFRVPTNQVVNRYLKEAIALTSIQKKITFHCSRHTFATIAITLGIPVEVVMVLLGHKDIRNTLIYAKVPTMLRIQEMKKWDQVA
jgi:integrase/recombinase XerC